MTKMAASLKNGGALALFWNDHRCGDPNLSHAVRQVYLQRAPELLSDRVSDEEQENRIVQEISSSGLFGAVEAVAYPWTVTQSAENYVKGISTYSRIQGLQVGTRQHLLDGLQSAIEQRGAEVESQYVSRLYLTRVQR